MNAMRTFDVDGTGLSPVFESHAEVRHHLVDARQRRAEAIAEMLASGFRSLTSPLHTLGAQFGRWHRQRRTYKALERCSDRVLADIGIERANIVLIARGIDLARYDVSKTGWRRWRHEMRLRLEAVRQAWRERRRIHRELMAYSDHDLDDLGIRRPDIPALAQGRLPTPA